MLHPTLPLTEIDPHLSKEPCCSCERHGVSKGKCAFGEGSIHSDNLKAKWKFSSAVDMLTLEKQGNL